MTTDGKGAGELAAILSGGHAPAGRSALHCALDELLDAAATDGGRLDAAAFWGFVGQLAQGRGIADEIADAAADHIAERGCGLPDDLAEAWQAVQWATLSAALTRLAGAGSILPTEFSAAAFRAVADNVLSGTNGGEAQDLLGLGTQRGTADNAEGRAARRLLVGAVFYRAEKTGQSVAKTRREMLSDLPDRTWKDWTREVAQAKRVGVRNVGSDARAAAQGEARTDPTVYNLDADAIARLLRVAWRPNA